MLLNDEKEFMDLDLLVKREHLTGLELPGKTLYSLPVLKALLSNHIISLPGIASLHPQIIKFTQTRWLRMEAGDARKTNDVIRE